MGARFRSWWQQIKKHRVAIGVVGIGLVVVIVLIITGYLFDWTGFNGYNKVTIAHTISGTNAGTVTKTEEYQPGKALWDWLQLLIIPLVLAAAALLFNRATTRTEQSIALDKQREDLLQVYLDRMSELLLEKSLATSPSEEARNVARVRTITILFQLDARRIGYVFAFLREAGLMSAKSSSSIVSLSQANLNKINLSQANLNKANLSGANLSGANLSEADLSGANLSEAKLIGGANLSGANLWEANLSGAYLYGANLNKANLSKANLSGANLSGANLWEAKLIGGANLSGAYLWEANLSGANLYGANLWEANLSGAYLYGANLSGANLSEANLSGVDLSEADLSGAKVTEEQLKKAKSLTGATMPDGSIHP